MTDQTDDKHEQQVAILCKAHVDWMQEHCPCTFKPLAVFEAHMKAAASCCVGAGLDLDETAGLMEDFLEAFRRKEGEADLTRGTVH